jgi:hypothetical protein
MNEGYLHGYFKTAQDNDWRASLKKFYTDNRDAINTSGGGALGALLYLLTGGRKLSGGAASAGVGAGLGYLLGQAPPTPPAEGDPIDSRYDSLDYKRGIIDDIEDSPWLGLGTTGIPLLSKFRKGNFALYNIPLIIHGLTSMNTEGERKAFIEDQDSRSVGNLLAQSLNPIVTGKRLRTLPTVTKEFFKILDENTRRQKIYVDLKKKVDMGRVKREAAESVSGLPLKSLPTQRPLL